jgi:hypothetical protein
LKLEEADFFLDLAEKSQDNVKVFSFFINAFFAAATSIRVGKGVMKTEYRNIQGFKAWFQKARDDLNVKFPIDFWVDKTRNGIIHREGNIQGEFRRKVTAALRLQRNKDGRMCPLFKMTLPPTTEYVLPQDFTRRKEEMLL